MFVLYSLFIPYYIYDVVMIIFDSFVHLNVQWLNHLSLVISRIISMLVSHFVEHRRSSFVCYILLYIKYTISTFTECYIIGYTIVIMNTLVLFMSTIIVILYALTYITLYSIFAVLVGIIFLITQFSELSLPNSLNGSIIFSSILILINIHGTHMILGCVAFICVLLNNFCTYYDNYLELIIIYWHLIELVWCILLLIVLNY